MKYVIRANCSDESIALIEYMDQLKLTGTVVYIDTGWAAKGWDRRVQATKEWVLTKGFSFVALKSPMTFSELVRDRKAFPSRKFQWCAGLLKGIPLLQWLDEQDPSCETVVCIAKRQARMREPLPEFIEECEYHGDRRVWHPLWQTTDETLQGLLAFVPLAPHARRSLECDPCVNSSPFDLTGLQAEDFAKTLALEQEIKASLVYPACFDHNLFSLGCGDPFGCGL